jgi:hypothetical protein
MIESSLRRAALALSAGAVLLACLSGAEAQDAYSSGQGPLSAASARHALRSPAKPARLIRDSSTQLQLTYIRCDYARALIYGVGY